MHYYVENYFPGSPQERKRKATAKGGHHERTNDYSKKPANVANLSKIWKYMSKRIWYFTTRSTCEQSKATRPNILTKVEGQKRAFLTISFLNLGFLKNS